MILEANNTCRKISKCEFANKPFHNKKGPIIMVKKQVFLLISFQLCDNHCARKVIMAEEREREVKNAAKDLVKSQRRAARWICLGLSYYGFSLFVPFTFLQGGKEEGKDPAQNGLDRGGGDE